MSLLLALSMAGMSQETPAAAVVRALPLEVAGLSQHWDHQTSKDQPLIAFMGGDALGPLITVAVTDIAASGDFKTARATAIAQPNSFNVLKTYFEGRFAVPSKAGANTFFGEYLTEKGLWQVWLIEHRGVRTTVSARILRMEDRRRMFDAVREQLLGGATIIRNDQPVAAKD